CFLAPENMTEEIRSYCRRTGQTEPQTTGEIAACIYHSLAESYVATVKEIEHMTGKCYSRLHIVGGGSNADYLNELTARETGKEIVIGPTEATAIGNLAVQMIKDGVFANLENARECIGQSFDIRCIK
ncbi:MAG TPA: FGGY-family carbohydrate kinase, partial [Mobilitalea sp.]|nr:FGGY-family carbohydrate kinase [Mobilitalea sp.]